MTGNWDILGIWVGVGLTLVMYSFLYKDNPIFRFGEHLYLGVSVGYLFVQAVFTTLRQQIWVPVLLPLLYQWQQKGGQSGLLKRYLDWATDGYSGGPSPSVWSIVLVVIPLILGLLIYARLSQKLAWISRYTFAFVVGVGSGVAIPLTIAANLLKQLYFTVQPFLAWGELTPWNKAWQVVVVVGVMCTVSYFLFSVEHKGPLRVTSRIGIYFLMISFGATFGYTVMGRMALFTDRLQTLLDHTRWDPAPIRLRNDVQNWEKLAKKMDAAAGPAKRIAELMTTESRAAVHKAASMEAVDTEGKESVAAALNEVMAKRELYREEDFAGVQLPKEAADLAKKDRATLSNLEVTRLNRTVLQGVFPRELGRVGANPYCATWAMLVLVMSGLVAWEMTRKKVPSEGAGH